MATPRAVVSNNQLCFVWSKDDNKYNVIKLRSTDIETIEEKDIQIVNPIIFKVDKILTSDDGKLYIKWKGYDDSYNCWINETDVEIEKKQTFYNKLQTCVGRELHLSGYSYVGPFTQFNERKAEMLEYLQGNISECDCKYNRCSLPFNRVDAYAFFHDYVYSKTDDPTQRHISDIKLRDEVRDLLRKDDLSTAEYLGCISVYIGMSINMLIYKIRCDKTKLS